MTRDARFWRNVTIVGLIHLAILLGLFWWSRSPRSPAKDIVWTYTDDRPAGIHHFQILDTGGRKIEGRPLR